MTMPPKLLNGALIQARRVSFGLSVATMAARLGISADVLRAIEAGATGQVAMLPLAVLRLAANLHLAPAELFTIPPADPIPASGDDQVVEAVLLAYGDTITTDTLAEVLGWPYGRIERALTALARRLHATGGRLHRAGWHRYRIQPNRRSLPEQVWRRLDQAHHEYAGLTPAAAIWLYHGWHSLTLNLPMGVGINGWEHNPGLRQLRERGLVVGDQPPFRLAPDVRYSLGLDEQPI
jgi:transcriptional regulator with XRE-family HTH domain